MAMHREFSFNKKGGSSKVSELLDVENWLRRNASYCHLMTWDTQDVDEGTSLWTRGEL